MTCSRSCARSLCLLSAAVTVSAIKIDYDQIEPGHQANLIASGAILVGTILAFFGLKLFKPTIFVVAFCAATAVAFHILNDHIDGTAELYGISAAVGAVAGIAALSVASLGTVVIGLCAGALLAYGSYVGFLHYVPKSENHILLYCVVAGAGLLGALLGFKAFRVVIGAATAFLGSFLVVSGIDLLTDRQLTPSNVEEQHLNNLGWSLLGIWVLMTVLGGVFQAHQHTKSSKPKRTTLTAPLYSEHSSLVHSAPRVHRI